MCATAVGRSRAGLTMFSDGTVLGSGACFEGDLALAREVMVSVSGLAASNVLVLERIMSLTPSSSSTPPRGSRVGAPAAVYDTV